MRIPTDITPLAYIAGSGSQYIETAIHLLSTDVVKSKWRFQNSAGNVYGCFTGSNDNDNFCLYAGSASTNAYIRYNGQLARNFKATSGTVYEIEQGPDGFFVGGSKVADFDAATFTCSAPMYIFMLPNSSSAKVTARCYYLQVIRGGEVVYDFIPARNEATGEVGMWEAVHGAWYGNDGTGAFTAGDVAERVLGTTHDGWRRRLMMAVVNGVEIPPLTGYTTFGYPSIVDGQMTVSANNTGIATPEIFTPGSSAWEIRTKIYYIKNRWRNFIWTGDSNYALSNGCLLQSDNTVMRWYLSSNGSSWDVPNRYGAYLDSITENIWHWFKVGYNGNGKYYIYESTDGVNWRSQLASNNYIYNHQLYICFGASNNLPQCTYDLNETSIYINNKLWWKAI